MAVPLFLRVLLKYEGATCMYFFRKLYRLLCPKLYKSLNAGASCLRGSAVTALPESEFFPVSFGYLGWRVNPSISTVLS